VDEDGTWLVRARVPGDVARYPATGAARPGSGGDGGGGSDTMGARANTVIGVIVTDARLSKPDVHRVADLAHSGIARAVRPAHTQLDGDALFALATGTVDAGPAAVDLVAALAADAVADAVRRAVRLATGDAHLPGLGDA